MAAAALALATFAAVGWALWPAHERDPTRVEIVVKLATQHIDERDILSARRLLESYEPSEPGVMTLMLAETYDPSVLAAWNAPPGIEADPNKARTLYEKAAKLGIPGAKGRLDDLNQSAQPWARDLLRDGRKRWEQGHVAAARGYFERAAELGLADAAFALAMTFDPAELARAGFVGVQPDPDEARKWYERARALGHPEAEARLERLRQPPVSHKE